MRQQVGCCCHQIRQIGWGAPSMHLMHQNTEFMLSDIVWATSEVSEGLGHINTSVNPRYEMGCGILDPLKRTDCRLWKTGEHRVAVVKMACDEGSDETGCDFGTEYTTDLLQSSNLKETATGHLVNVLLQG
jgi:hypothetical protein